jgi:histidyl-tRNA synthetase
MRDIMPDDLAVFRHVESVFRETCRLFAFREIRTPHLESTDLFCRTVGETTDIVEKEMYSLETKGGDRLSLRPENTAGVVRAYLEGGLHRTAPLQKFFYWGEMFRHEAKQKRRYREFTQAGVELIGSEHPEADVEVISLAVEFFRKLGLGDVRVELSTFGCPECRPAFREALLEYFKEREAKLCRDCKRRLERNVFRLLDCKEDTCRALAADAPTMDDFLDDKCRDHFAGGFKSVRMMLDDLGIEHTLNRRLVRGLDYYTRTIFEIFPAGGEGRQDALGAGGRYDGLAELVGGKPAPAVGFALGVDRIVLAVTRARAVAATPDVFVASFVKKSGDVTQRFHALKWANELRRAGIATEAELRYRNLDRQLSSAAKSGAPVTVLVGGEEFTREAHILRNMRTRQQREIPFADLVPEVKRELNRVGEQAEETKS